MITNYELEQSVLASLLTKKDLINNLNIEAEWFVNPVYQDIFVALDIFKGEFNSLFEIQDYAKTLNPNSSITYKMLVDIKDTCVTTSNLQSEAETLHKVYLDRELVKTSERVLQGVTDDIVSDMKDILTQIERIGVKSDNGDLTETYDEVATMLETEGDYGIKTFGNLDYKLGGGLYGGMLVTIGARPGVGKTAFAAVNLVEKAFERNKNIAVDVFTLEMGKREMVNRFISMHTGISTFKLRTPKNILMEKEKKEVLKTLDFLKTYDLRVHDKSSYLHEIVAQIKNRVFEHGDKPYMVVIDYLGLIKIKGNFKDRRLEIESITRELKILANELNIAIVLLSQLSRGVEGRQDKTPVLSDLRESGSIEQDSNVVAFLHRPDEQNKELVELAIRKNREGSLADCKFNFDGTKMRFEAIYE